MTRTLRTSFITIASATALASIAMFSQGASAGTANTNYSATSQAQMLKHCARLENQDTSGCREIIRYKKRHVAELLKSGGGGGGEGGRGGRK